MFHRSFLQVSKLLLELLRQPSNYQNSNMRSSLMPDCRRNLPKASATWGLAYQINETKPQTAFRSYRNYSYGEKVWCRGPPLAACPHFARHRPTAEKSPFASSMFLHHSCLRSPRLYHEMSSNPPKNHCGVEDAAAVVAAEAAAAPIPPRAPTKTAPPSPSTSARRPWVILNRAPPLVGSGTCVIKPRASCAHGPL